MPPSPSVARIAGALASRRRAIVTARFLIKQREGGTGFDRLTNRAMRGERDATYRDTVKNVKPGEVATLPLALQLIAVMVTAIPASMLMRRIGRRP